MFTFKHFFLLNFHCLTCSAVDYEGLKKMWQKRAVAVRLVIMKLLAPRPGRQQPFYNLTHSTIATCSLSICTCLFNCWLFSESCCWFILWKRVVPWTTFIPKLLLQRGKKQVDNKELLPTRRFKGTNVENKKRLEYWVVSTETLTGHKLAMPIYVCFCTWTSRSLK